MSTKSSPVRIALVAATFLVLAACGNKGPLVMPQKPVPVEAQPVIETPPQTEPASQTPQPTDDSASPVKDSDGR